MVGRVQMLMSTPQDPQDRWGPYWGLASHTKTSLSPPHKRYFPPLLQELREDQN